jgi:Domain of unknown function (DUF3943)
MVKMIKQLLFYLFFFPGLFLTTVDAFSQFVQIRYNIPELADSVSLDVSSILHDDLALSDSDMNLHFIQENKPAEIEWLSPLFFLHKDIKKLPIHAGLYQNNFSSPYFISDRSKISEFKNPIAADSFRLRNQGASIWKKMGRAEMFIGGTEIICMGVLMALPKEVTKWQPGFLDDAMKNVKKAFSSPPVNDEDDWGFNFVGHPYAGSLYYNSIRSQDATIFQSFVFSFAQSFVWEYLIEGMAEQPSLQDMIITPIFGTLLGEASHVATIKMRRNGFNWLEKITVIVLNPFYAVNNGFRTTNKKVVTTK